jgi:Fe-S-cluster containining protein
MEDFECLKCGTCCRTIVESIGSVTRGLMLTSKERALFPAESILPQFALGLSKPKIIVFYQMTLAQCPHLDEQSGCKIYEKRPLICRAFPLMANHISSRCKVFNKRKVGQVYQDIYPMVESKKANEKIDRYIKTNFNEYLRKGFNEWEYDLSTKTWIPRH